MPTKYDNLFFDLDGTLLETTRGFTKSVAYAFDKMGIPYESVESLQKYLGPPLKLTCKNVLGMSEEDALKAVGFFREKMGSGAMLDADEFAGLREALAAMQKAGYRMFVTTSKPQAFTDKTIDHFDMRSFFKDVIGSGMDHTRLTKKELIEYCMQEHSLDPARCVMIGDRYVDIIGANEAGIDSIGVGYGSAQPGEWEKTPPTHFVQTVDDLRRLLLEELL